MLKSSALFSALAPHSNHNLIKSGSNTSSLSSRRPSKRLGEREQGQEGSWRWTFRLELEPVHLAPYLCADIQFSSFFCRQTVSRLNRLQIPLVVEAPQKKVSVFVCRRYGKPGRRFEFDFVKPCPVLQLPSVSSIFTQTHTRLDGDFLCF